MVYLIAACCIYVYTVYNAINQQTAVAITVTTVDDDTITTVNDMTTFVSSKISTISRLLA